MRWPLRDTPSRLTPWVSERVTLRADWPIRSLSRPITASTTRTSSVGSVMATGRSASRRRSLAATIS